MALDDDIALLARQPLLGLMERDALRLIAFAAESRILRAGDVLFRVGEPSDGAVLVISGAVALDSREDGQPAQEIVGPGALIGPYARLRPGADIGEEVHIGNFVEVKKVHLDKGAKANHLSYLGDGTVGAGANIGAGTIFCNYDGFDKYETHVGPGAFIGSNTAIVAPRSIGAGAMTGSGSVIVRDVPDDALAVARGEQSNKAGWAATFRARKAAEKLARKNKAGA